MLRKFTHRLIRLFLVGVSLTIWLAASGLTYAQVAKIEVFPIESMTLSDEELLAGKKEGKPITLAGELRIPQVPIDCRL